MFKPIVINANSQKYNTGAEHFWEKVPIFCMFEHDISLTFCFPGMTETVRKKPSCLASDGKMLWTSLKSLVFFLFVTHWLVRT